MKATKIELYTETKIGIAYYPEDFEGSDTTWEEFLDKVTRDKTYMKELFTREIISDADGLMNDLADQIIKDKTVILIGIETNTKKTRMVIRDA